MKPPEILLLTLLTITFNISLAQSIVGSWQLVKQSNCLEEQTNDQPGELGDLRQEMHAQNSPGQQVVNFKSNSSGEESTRILNSGKVANPKKFFYKFNGDMLLILDKKTQTISDNYIVDKFSTDSLIISNAARPCQTMIFLKITKQPPN